MCMFFFFKQKTAYEMRISDWSSDVCSSDLLVEGYPWRVLEGHTGKRYAYAMTREGGRYMHRIIAGTPKGMETDHINCDGLDNRRVNLRVEIGRASCRDRVCQYV